jgi:hypothetical protein
MLTTVARNVKCNADVMGNVLPIDINIENSYKASIDFSLFCVAYTFTIERWAKRGLSGYLIFFHSFAARDVTLFGLKTEDLDGMVSYYEDATDLVLNADGTYTKGPGSKAMTVRQKLNCVEQGCKDIITCLGQIVQAHQRSMMEYAIWFHETYQTPDDYRDFITLMTCQCVLHNDFMAPNITWSVVKFH